jgi:hypothetical protein
MYPDLVLLSLDRGHRLQVIVEIETGESVNHLEALAQWTPYSKVRAAFHLYVPAGMVDVARRLCEDNHVYAAEIWSYHIVGDQPRFTLVHRNREAPPVARTRPAPRPAIQPAAPRAKPTPPAARPAHVAKPKPKPKPKAKPKTKPKKAAGKKKRK